MQVGPPIGRFRLFHCRLKKIGITNINRTTVVGDLVNVNLHHIAEFEKLDLSHLLCQLPQIVAKLFVDRFEACCQFLLARLVSTWRYQDLVAVRTQLKWRFSGNLKHIQDWLVDHQGETIAVFNQHFLHLNSFTQWLHKVYTLNPAKANAILERGRNCWYPQQLAMSSLLSIR